MPSAPIPWELETDLLIVGSGIGGVTAALLARELGMRALVLEKSELLGGGSCMSGGRIWVPLNRVQREQGLADSREEVLGYIRATSFGRHDEAKAAAYIDNVAPITEYLERRTPLKLVRHPPSDDYYRYAAGSKAGRTLWPDEEESPRRMEPRAQRQPLLAKVRPSAYAPGWLQGLALVGPIISACIDAGVDFLLEAPGKQLLRDETGRVTGVRAQKGGRELCIRARRAVLIASGGYEWNTELNRRFMPAPLPIFPTTPPSNEGDGQLMGMELGAALALMDQTVMMATPVTLDGQRQAPGIAAGGARGVIMVNRYGKRATNESFYAAPGKAIMNAATGRESNYPNFPLYMLADSSAANPKTRDLPHVAKGNTLRELAHTLQIDADGLEQTVQRFNHFARQGKDPDYERGQISPYGPWAQDDQVGSLEQPPYYAARLGMATAGHRGGLVTNIHGQVLDVRNRVIPGLYATSNAAAQLSVGAGYTTGQCNALSMVFGYLAAKHAAAA